MKPHQRIFGIQFVFALSIGALLARLPDLQRSFELTEGELGLLLVGMSLGALFGLTVSVPIIERLGPRMTAFISVFGASFCYATIPWMPTALLAAPLFFFAGVLSGGLEVSLNVEADRHEALLGRRIMSRAHGMWSLGIFVTALIAAGARQAEVSPEAHLFAMSVFVVAVGCMIFSGIERTAKLNPESFDETHHVAFPTIALLPLCLIGAAPLLAEGASIDWSAIYMRDVFAVEPFVGGLSVTIFSLLMAIARLTMDPVVDKFRPHIVASTLLSIAIIGIVLVAAAPHPYIALIGFALAGVGCSSIFPLAISAAARRTDRPASVNVAALGQTTFVVFFAGPPLLGFVAEEFGIRFSYWAVLPLLIVALLATKSLAAPANTGSE